MTDIHVQHQGQGPRLSPVQSTVTQRHQPSGVGVNVGSSTQGVGAMGREYKDQGEEALYSAERTAERSMEQLKHAGEKAYDKICAVCHNPRQYPKLLTTVVLLSCFLLGSLTTGVVTKMVPSLGGSRHYVSSHWDKETAHAHHLLDVVIDQVKHPHLYEGQKSTSYVNQARNTLMDLFSGILPGRKKHPMKGQPMFDPRTGRKLGSKMGEMMEDAGDTASDIYNVGMRTAKKAGRKIGDVASDAASSVKGVFSQDANYPVHDESSWSHGGGGWLGGSEWHGDENNEELTEATSQLRNIIRKAERNQ